MSGDAQQRRLSAILAADVSGYTRLVEQDTDGTVAAWQAARADIIDPAISDHSGRIVKHTGDGFLAEFSSVQDAVRCAVSMQEGLSASPLDFRMGINLGDVVDDGEDIHGESVNIAARIEALADPGGISISSSVCDQVRDRLDHRFEDLGEHEFKHVSAPVRVYAIRLGATEAPALFGQSIAGVSTPAADKLSIAVLPFDNLSGDPQQEAFADGMTEDLITDLSKISGLFVVARNASSAYKGLVDIREVADKLSVRYVLEGSVRKSGEQVRINAQLIDAATGEHLWADRYDGTVHDVFELQDEGGAKVVSALSVQLTTGEQESLRKVHTQNLEAYELFVRAKATPYPPVPDRINAAREMFEQVIEMDPDFAGGYAGVANMLAFRTIFAHGLDSSIVERAEEMARKGIDLDPTLGWSYTGLGFSLILQGKLEDGITAAREAIRRQPDDADAHAFLGMFLGITGNSAEGVACIERAIQLNPQFVNGPYLNQLAHIHAYGGNYEAARDAIALNLERKGSHGPPAQASLVAAYQGLGQTEKAREVVVQLIESTPDFRLAG
jgi:adenylate cyclase